jgi:hypothetical protein
VINGEAVGATAVVTGPEPTLAAETYPRHAPATGRPEVVAVDDLGWRPGRAGYELRVYYRS